MKTMRMFLVIFLAVLMRLSKTRILRAFLKKFELVSRLRLVILRLNRITSFIF